MHPPPPPSLAATAGLVWRRAVRWHRNARQNGHVAPCKGSFGSSRDCFHHSDAPASSRQQPWALLLAAISTTWILPPYTLTVGTGHIYTPTYTHTQTHTQRKREREPQFHHLLSPPLRVQCNDCSHRPYCTATHAPPLPSSSASEDTALPAVATYRIFQNSNASPLVPYIPALSCALALYNQDGFSWGGNGVFQALTWYLAQTTKVPSLLAVNWYCNMATVSCLNYTTTGNEEPPKLTWVAFPLPRTMGRCCM